MMPFEVLYDNVVRCPLMCAIVGGDVQTEMFMLYWQL